MKFAWTSDYGYAAVDPEVLQVTERAAQIFAGLGATVDDGDLNIEDPFPSFWDIFATASYTSYQHMIDDNRAELTDYGVVSMDHGGSVTGSDLSRAIYHVDQLGRYMEEFFDDFDLLLSPTMAVPAFPIHDRPRSIGGRQVDPFWGFVPFTYPINMSGQTAASIPCG